MIPDLSSIFVRYEALVAEADTLFARVQAQYSDCVQCVKGCSDCCHALFDISLVEAMYMRRAFDEHKPHSRERSDILTRASVMDRQAVRIKRDMYKAHKTGTSPEEILDTAAKVRIACPLLGDDNECVLYTTRPITCRLYGIPFNIAGKGHVCGKTGFAKGGSFPAVNMDIIQARLEGLSHDIATAVQSRYKELHQVYVPVSMALITTYDEHYLGIGPAKPEEKNR